MGRIIRFGVSMEEKLLEAFDRFIKREGYKNRSEAIRDVIRKEFVEEEWEKDIDVAGCILLVYDHHKRDLVTRIMDIQHDYYENIVSTQHIHMDHHNCLEIIVVKGKAGVIRQLYGLLKSLKGVKYSTLSKASTGRKI
ncbi:MAG TPA: nickel-responsive transcriptional regulator NikR [bacterium]|nr:nickel-responsive transcriptional regulator NikR [bacterium]HPP30060.1 nickel-responsive transcriptional regulator NikR [bacterium]